MSSPAFHEEDPVAKSYDRTLLRRLLGYLRPYKLPVLVSFLLIVIMAGLDLVGPYLTKVAIDRYIRQGDASGLDAIALLYLGTLIAAFLVRFERVGIVAVDPSSPFSGGAILGDRIRMQALGLDDGVFIRSMATRGNLGGLSRTTVDAVAILDAAGFEKCVKSQAGWARLSYRAPARGGFDGRRS